MKYMQISPDETKKIAKLCNLTLSDEEVEKLSKMLSSTLDYINVLDELDVTNTPETFQVTGTKNVFQKGNSATMSLEDTFKNRKIQKRGLFVTKAVFNR